MAEPRSTMIDPPIEVLLDKVDSKFTLVTLAAKRGRQVNSYFSQLGEGLGAIVPPQVASIARKPLSIALEEIAAGKVVASGPWRRRRSPRPKSPAPRQARSPPSPERLASPPKEARATAVSDSGKGPDRAPGRSSLAAAFGGATVVLGVSGGIAAYKAVELCRRLVDAGAHVVPVLTESATHFVGLATFSALGSEPARLEMFADGARFPTQRSASAPTSCSSRRLRRA